MADGAKAEDGRGGNGERILGASYLFNVVVTVAAFSFQPLLVVSGSRPNACALTFMALLGCLLLVGKGRMVALVITSLGLVLVLVSALVVGGFMVPLAGWAVISYLATLALLTEPRFKRQIAAGTFVVVLSSLVAMVPMVKPALLLEAVKLVEPLKAGVERGDGWRVTFGPGWYRPGRGARKPKGANQDALFIRVADMGMLMVHRVPIPAEARGRRIDPDLAMGEYVKNFSTFAKNVTTGPSKLQLRESQRTLHVRGDLEGLTCEGDLLVTVGDEGFLIAAAVAPSKVYPSVEPVLHRTLATVWFADAAPPGAPLLEPPTSLAQDPSPAPGPPSPTPAAPTPAIDWNDPGVLLGRATSEDPTVRGEAVRRWLDGDKHRVERARLTMLKAVGIRPGAEVDELLARSFEAPIGGREALECLPLAPPACRAVLLRRLGRVDPGVAVEEVAAAIEALPDTKELSVEEALLRLGRPRPGAVERLIDARGWDWTRSAEGRALLRVAPAPAVGQLLRAERDELRLLGVALLAERGAEVAVEHLMPAVVDRSPAVRQEAAGALERLKAPRAALLLARALRVERDEPTKVRLRRALAALPQAAAAEALVERLADEAPDARLDAVTGLELCASGPGVQALAQALDDPDAAVRLSACRSLGGLRASRAVGVAEALRGVHETIRRVALQSPDDELRRVARNVYFQLTNRVPGQDSPGGVRLPARGGVSGAGGAPPEAEAARPQVVWQDGGWTGDPDARYAFEADPRLLVDLQLDARFRATVEGIHRLAGSKVELVGLRARLEVRGAQGWRVEEKSFELALDAHQRVVTALGSGRFRVEDVRRTMRMDHAWFVEKVGECVQGAIRVVRTREQNRR